MWTDEAVNLVVDEWAAGISASGISTMLAEMGIRKTRNAVIGKISRMGLQRTTPTRDVPRKRRTKRELIQAQRAWNQPRPPKPQETTAAKRSLREALILSLPPLEPARQIETIRERECRYICDDPRNAHWAFCARPTVAGSWCEHHRWLVASPEMRARVLAGEQQQGAGV